MLSQDNKFHFFVIKMYTGHIIIAAFVISAASSVPLPPELHSPPAPRAQNRNGEITIVRSESESGPGNGEFHWVFENSDGTKSEQKGYLKNAGTENEIQVMEGSYSYTLDGQTYTVTYIADENGYQPSGPHLPK